MYLFNFLLLNLHPSFFSLYLVADIVHGMIKWGLNRLFNDVSIVSLTINLWPWLKLERLFHLSTAAQEYFMYWPLTTFTFKEKVSFNTKMSMLRCFINEIISINVIFMYWMLPWSSRIAPANVTFPLKYLKQDLSQLPHSFYGHIDYTAK